MSKESVAVRPNSWGPEPSQRYEIPGIQNLKTDRKQASQEAEAPFRLMRTLYAVFRVIADTHPPKVSGFCLPLTLLGSLLT